MPAAAQDPLIGKTLEKVRILSKLGAGGMGAVYLAEHQTLGKKVAVKILPEHLSKDPEYVARFRREAETCAKLEHANIVQVSDVGSEDGRFFIVMQYVEGESLQSILEQLGTIEPRDAARVVIGILNGLDHAHRSGIVHRDIKPDNILITKDNQPKITDFGLAIETEATQKLTADGTVVGTPYFISPEQAKGRKAEPRSDIYSLGVTLYYMVTGRVPFQGQTALAVLNKHIHETPISPSNLNPKVSPVLNEIILKLLAKKPEERYLSAEAARRDLQAFLDNKPISLALKKPAPPPEQARTSSKGLTAAIVGAVAILVVIAIAIGSSGKTNPIPPVKNGGKPLVDPGPVESEALKEERRKLEAIVREAEEFFEDHGSYPRMLRKFEDFVSAHKDTPLYADASDKQSAYLGRINDQGERAFQAVEAGLKGDVFAQLDALRKFPRGLWRYTERGRWVEKRIPELEAQARSWVAEELNAIDRLIVAEEFVEARSRLKAVSDRALESRDRIAAFTNTINENEPVAMAKAVLNLRSALEVLESRVNDLLARSQPTAAWRLALEFVSTRKPTSVEGRVARLSGLDYAALARIDLEKASEADLQIALVVIEKGLVDAKDDPAGGLAVLLEDLAQTEWLLRRAVRGIQRVSGGSFFLEGAKGILSWGEPPTFAPEGGPSRPVFPRQLAPADVIALASAADYGANAPAAEAFQKNKGLCAAAGAAYLRSRVEDRFNAARRWFVQAAALGVEIASWRLNHLDHEAEVELEKLSRVHLAAAHKFVEQKKWADAAKALDDVEAKTKGLDLFLTLGPLLRSHRVKFLGLEARAAIDVRNYARAREIVALLRKKYDGEFNAMDVEEISCIALLGSGSWTNTMVPESTAALKGTVWGWDGKKDGTLPPAKVENGTELRLDRGMRMMLNPDKTEGTNGMTAKIRLNQLAQAWSYGFHFDVTDNDTQGKWVTVSAAGLQVFNVNNGKSVLNAGRAMPVRVQVGTWIELSWVADKERGEVVFYVDRQPALTIKAVLDEKNAIGISAAGDVSFKELKLRRGK